MWKFFESREDPKAPSILVALAVAVSGCSPLSGYEGNGQFLDRGWLSTERYVVDLGPVDLGRPGRYHYRLAGLPSERMTIGLEIVEAEGADLPPRPSHPARISITLQSGDNQLVVQEDASLNDWAWSRARMDSRSFYYRKGELRYVPVGPGVTQPERVGEKADGGWGSTFVPGRSRAYVLSFEVVNGEKTSAGSARLLLKGGGMTYP